MVTIASYIVPMLLPLRLRHMHLCLNTHKHGIEILHYIIFIMLSFLKPYRQKRMRQGRSLFQIHKSTLKSNCDFFQTQINRFTEFVSSQNKYHNNENVVPNSNFQTPF